LPRDPLCAAAILCAILGAWTPPAARAASSATASVQSRLAYEMRLAGSSSGAYVYDVTAHQVVFSQGADVARAPASVEKLYTATSALERIGPSGRLSTTVLGAGRLAPEGVWEGDLYLRGGGDPTFGSTSFIRAHYGGQGASVSALASQLVHVDGIREVTGAVDGDESFLDSLRGEPSSGYRPDPFLEGTLSGLAFNRGQTGSEHGRHAPAAYAAQQLSAALKAAGVTVAGGSGAAVAPPGATQLAQVQSPTVAELLRLTLPPSDNFFAETVVKDLGARFAGRGATAAGAAVVSQTVAGLGLRPTVVDGSGLSRADQTSPHQVVALLSALAPTPIGTILRGDLAEAGRTGTLSERMRGTAAVGRCEGKTGTLIGVSNLAGYCRAADGHLLAFAFFDDGIEIPFAHTVQDNMTVALADY